MLSSKYHSTVVGTHDDSEGGEDGGDVFDGRHVPFSGPYHQWFGVEDLLGDDAGRKGQDGSVGEFLVCHSRLHTLLQLRTI